MNKLIIFALVAIIAYHLFLKEGFSFYASKKELLEKLKKMEVDYVNMVVNNLKTGFYNKKAVNAAEEYNAYIDAFAPEFVDPNTTQKRKDEILAEVRRLGKIYDTESKLMKDTINEEVNEAMKVIKFRKDFRNTDGTFNRNPSEIYPILGMEYENTYKEFAPNQVWNTL
jgi:hypothetical protein